MKQESAEVIALKTLTWLVGDEEILPIFLGSSGMSPEELRMRATEMDVLSAVLDFVTMNDEWVNACAMATGLDPHDPMRARQALPGGADIHWT
ncbi:DUF3572 domain-containing protein [Celeribacter baekdonensis]|uniref:DUF3572 domain-containing protein n=1 Tax=Celeribacter baekdonensis B30 TaxID=1208323 RepID=K2JH82_9RHOB|nr:DUF3572 domain-containing protein [Celeribacter baekdonensis]EKE70034.1 hypothetical protein B30_14144 [Celeribacter baekdonensis B30]